MSNERAIRRILALVVFLVLALSGARAARSIGGQSQPEIAKSQTIEPEELKSELATAAKPIVVCVAPHFLYEGAHIPGALFHGPGSTPEGLENLREWAKGTSRDRTIVIYCGCCPMARCPNVRPASSALREMGFRHVKVLWLSQDFHTDWTQKGYPVEKGQ
jgi:thiosulfate/3-mercaptopyruvate sulfurtransferase